MTAQEAADLVSDYSDELNDAHYDVAPGEVHYTGGSSHNDDRLKYVVLDDGNLRITDGTATEMYGPPYTEERIRWYVKDWLETLWETP